MSIQLTKLRPTPAFWSRAFVVLDQGLLSGFGFATTLLLMRGMGLDGFGVYALLGLGWLWALGILQALVTQPMQTLVGARAGRPRARYLAACQRITLGAAGIAAVAGCVVVLIWGLGAQVAFAFALFLSGRCLQAQYRAAAFVAGDRRGALYTDALGQGGGLFLLLVVGGRIQWDLASVLFVQGGLWWIACLFSWLRFEGRGVRALPIRKVAGQQWRFGRWLAGMAAVRWLSSNAFLLVVAAQMGPSPMGLLRGLQSIVGLIGLGLAALETVLPTTASLKRKNHGDRAAMIYLARFGIWSWFPVMLASGVLFLAADPILHWVLDGKVNEHAHGALAALLCLPISTLASTLYGIAYRTLERTDRMFVFYCIVALLVAWLAPIIVTEYGVLGAAWGIALQPAGLALLLAWGLSKHHRWSILPVSLPSRKFSGTS